MLDMDPVPIKTIDTVIKRYYRGEEARNILEQSEQYRRATVNSLCARGWIKTVDNKTFKTVSGVVLAP